MFPLAKWDAFVEQHPYGHFLQTNQWGELKSAHGWRSTRASLINSNAELVGGAIVHFRRLPYGLGSVAYVPRGPVVNWDDRDLAVSAVRSTSKIARTRGAIGIIIEPGLLDTPSDQRTLQEARLFQIDVSVQPRRTIWVNLDVEEEVDILALMRQKTRYNIGLAKRKGVIVREGGADDLTMFYNMMQTTSERNIFAIHPLDYYQTFMNLFASSSAHMASLLIAEHDKRPLAAMIVVAFGKRATYLYGASGNEGRELMPTYLLQWEAMRWARARGCVTYDLWGIPDEDEETLEANFKDRDDGLWGVYRFKRGFGGQVVRHIGAWAQVYSPLRWWLYAQARRIKKTSGLTA
ncbi:MAG: peptidoglycan bridge formation glycyltransferase FemA/FemB family protein [Chloroflexi bacterium]|nr:peptidoglycan bridge formation glycyltransferase FemA/FemB family protein [Chloroflexota bacterium]